MTEDQVLSLWSSTETLKAGAPVAKMGSGEAVAAGYLKPGKSLFQQAKERAARGGKPDPEAGLTKRQRRELRRKRLEQSKGASDGRN